MCLKTTERHCAVPENIHSLHKKRLEFPGGSGEGFITPTRNLFDSQMKCCFGNPFLLLEAKRTSLLFVKVSILSCFNQEGFGSSVWGSRCKIMLHPHPPSQSKISFDLVQFNQRFDLISHAWRMTVMSIF